MPGSLRSRAGIIRKGRRSDNERENEFKTRPVRPFPRGQGAEPGQPQLLPGDHPLCRRQSDSALCDGVFLRPDSEGAGVAAQTGRAAELGHCRGAGYRPVRHCEGGAVPAAEDRVHRYVLQKRDHLLPEVLCHGLRGHGQAGDPRPALADRRE